jgi:hypothetical protein
MSYRHLAGVLALGLFSGMAHAQEEKVYRVVTPALVEKVLRRSSIEFKKLADKKPNTFLYDYKTKNFNLRLYYLDGTRLMLDTLLGAMSLEKVNDWNLSAKFTRAGLGKDEKGNAYTVLESQLNLKGGVTLDAMREFLNAFVDELDPFQLFARDSEMGKDIAKEEKAFKEVSAPLMEKLLAELKIKYAKVPLASGNVRYQYESKDTKIVLTNWGKDMMLEAKFAKIALAKVNRYNLDRKFIRAVSYSNTKGDYTSLEANLNFMGGVTESIVRNFIAVFDEDVDGFAVYVRQASE